MGKPLFCHHNFLCARFQSQSIQNFPGKFIISSSKLKIKQGVSMVIFRKKLFSKLAPFQLCAKAQHRHFWEQLYFIREMGPFASLKWRHSQERKIDGNSPFKHLKKKSSYGYHWQGLSFKHLPYAKIDENSKFGL